MLENEVPFVLFGGLSITHTNTKLIVGEVVIIKIKESPFPGYKISIKHNETSIELYNLPGVFFTSYQDDLHGGDTNCDVNTTSPNSSDWYGISDYTATISTPNFCYGWSNIQYRNYQ